MMDKKTDDVNQLIRNEMLLLIRPKRLVDYLWDLEQMTDAEFLEQFDEDDQAGIKETK